MNRKIPVWILLLIILVGLNVVVLFGWAVRHAVWGYDRLGRVGPVVVTIASYPSLVKQALYDIGLLTHKYSDIDDEEPNRLPEQIQKNQFPEIDGFKINGVVQVGATSDNGYLLLPAYDLSRGQAVVKLIRIRDQKILHEWIPRILLKNKNLVEIFHPILTEGGGLLFHWHEGALVKVDVCSKIIWKTRGQFHHSNEETLDGNYWVPSVFDPSPYHEKFNDYRDDAITKISAEGKILYKKSVTKILERHGYQALIFGVGPYEGDELHLNDIQPAHYSTKYWEKGDILLSLRELSTVILYRPATDQIIWLKTGPWMAQHDADFLDESKIVVFGNDAIRGNTIGSPLVHGHSNVYVYDFTSNSITTPYSEVMKRADVSADIHGLQQILNNGDVFIDEQRRLLRLSEDKVIWQFTPKTSATTVAMPTWSRYLTEDDTKNILTILEDANCSG